MSSNTQYGYKIPLADRRDGAAIAGSGGSYMVCQAGTGKKQAIYNRAGTQLNLTTAFVALNNGLMEFYVPDTVNVNSAGVDIYGMAPDGQFFIALGVIASGPNQILVDRDRRDQVALIPFAAADSTAAAEKDTGMDYPANAIINPNVGVRTIGLESGKTIDTGILSSESGGDADGLVAAISVAAAVTVAAKSASTNTRGALLGGATLDRGYVVVAASQSASYTLSSGAAAAHGLIIVPYFLPFGF